MCVSITFHGIAVKLWNFSRICQYSILAVMSCPVCTVTAKNRNLSFSHQEGGLWCGSCCETALAHQDSISSSLAEGTSFLLASSPVNGWASMCLPCGIPHLEFHMHWSQVADVLSSFVSSTAVLFNWLMCIRISV